MTSERPSGIGRIVALFEVLLCSDYPTQFAVGATLFAFGLRPLDAHGALSLRYVVSLSLIDTALLVGLIVFFLRAHRERVRDVLLGVRSPLREAAFGLPLMIGAMVLALSVIAAVRFAAPSLHNLEHNPLQDLMHGRGDVALFALVVVVAGGIREEVQRAFILHRFDVWLGGTTTGLVISSLSFGIGHLLQGRDVAVATGMLGLYWGVVYIRRRSSIGPIVSHAGFNLLELLQYVAMGR